MMRLWLLLIALPALAVSGKETYAGPVQLEVRLQPLRGGPAEVLATVTLPAEPDYPLVRISPDRESFAYLAGGKLRLREADGSERDLGEVDGPFAFSRDGRRVIALVGDAVVSIDVDSGHRRKLPARRRADARRADADSPDGIHLPPLDYGEWIDAHAFGGGVVGVSRYRLGRLYDSDGLLF